MGSLLQNTISRIGRTFASFTAGQKAVSLLAVLGLVIGAFFLSTWAGKPAYAPLFTGLAPADASSITQDLDTAGTAYKLADGGNTIMVPQDVVYAERIRLAGQGLPAGDTTVGYPLLDKQSLTSSEFQQQTTYQRALEGELQKTIEALDPVNGAIVHLAVPKKDVFATEDGKPTASVLVKTKVGKDLTGEQVQTIVNLVSASVEGLEPAKVTVSDSTGRVLSTSDQNGAGNGDTRSRETADFEERTRAKVQSALERVVGPGNAVVQVTADLDYDNTTTKSRTYTDPKTSPLAESSTTEVYANGSGAGTTAVGVLGPDNAANTDGTVNDVNGTNNASNGTGTTTGTSTGNDYSKGSKNTQAALDQKDEERLAAKGGIRKLGIGVLLNAKVAGTLDQQAIKDLVVSSANMDLTTRKDQYSAAVLPFDESAKADATAELATQAATEKKAELIKLAKTVSLILVIFLMLIMAIFGGRKRSRAASALRKAELAAAQKRLDQLEMDRLRSLEQGESQAAIEAYDPSEERLTQVREEIGELVEGQPDEVAALLRSWLADRRS